MAELKGSNITSLVTKKARRAKARLMQNLGKGPERTEDEIFEVYQGNFFRQHVSALKLHRELKNYFNCMRAAHEARQTLNQCLLEMHEKDWTKHRVFEENMIEIDYVGDNLLEQFRERIMVPVEQYLSQFTDVRDKIAKRGRKLVDYDGSRYNFEAVKVTCASPASRKPSDDVKLAKARDQLEESRRVYETLNSELHDELPLLYDSRITLIVSILQRLYSAELSYHKQSTNIYSNLNGAVDQLAQKAQRGVYNMTGRPFPVGDLGELGSNLASMSMGDGQQRHSAAVTSAVTQAPRDTNQVSDANNPINGDQRTNVNAHGPDANHSIVSQNTDIDQQERQSYEPSSARRMSTTITSDKLVQPKDSDLNQDEQKNSNDTSDNSNHDSAQGDANQTDTPTVSGPIVVPANATTTDLPEGVLYRVKASYKYMAEDADELSFEAGETIQVINYDDPAEQEEGWLIGIRELDGHKGLFPANFTRVI